MSSSDADAASQDLLRDATASLSAAVAEPDRIPDEAFRELMASAVRLYAAKAEAGMRHPLPPGGAGLTITETMVTVTDLLHAMNVQLFELSMWQAMTGNCIAPHQRVDLPQS